MARMQKTPEQRIADLQAKRQKLDAQLRQVEERRRARDIRKWAKGEKLLLQLALGLAARDESFKSQLLAELDAAPLKPEDREAAHWVLTTPKTDIAAKPAQRPKEAA